MPPRWESPFDPPSPRDAALLAEVLGTLRTQLTEATESNAPSNVAAGTAPGAAASAPGDTPTAALTPRSLDAIEAPSAEVQELISAAVSELHRVAPPLLQGVGVAPVLGSGVVQELLRRKRAARGTVLEDPPQPTVDERL